MIDARTVRLLDWYAVHRRTLPWREQPTPYGVVVSEFMLQQTQVSQALGYYKRFMARFPDFAALAAAEESAVLEVWQGLGYYKRARQLKALADAVVRSHGGFLPAEPESLKQLPGVGPYTLGAILCIAFGQTYPAVDGNVRRVLSRLTALQAVDGRTQQKALTDTWRCLADGAPAAAFAQALMELGALTCTPRAPNCLTCPWQEDCTAHLVGQEERYPPAVKRRPPSIRRARLLLITDGSRALFAPGPAAGLLAGLWRLPTYLEPDEPTPQLLDRLGAPSASVRLEHRFTHQQWLVEATVHGVAGDFAGASDWVWHPLATPPPLGGPSRKVLAWGQGLSIVDARRAQLPVPAANGKFTE